MFQRLVGDQLRGHALIGQPHARHAQRAAKEPFDVPHGLFVGERGLRALLVLITVLVDDGLGFA